MKKSLPPSDAVLAMHEQHFAGLKRELDELRYFCKGTVLKRMMKCGKQRCACHQDPAKRHGPYFEWTYKYKGKTVNVRLSSEEVSLYEAATQQYRELQLLLKRMEESSRKAIIHLASRLRSETPNSGRT